MHDQGPTLYKCYTNCLCLLGILLYCMLFKAVNSTSDTAVYHEEDWAVDTHITVDRLAASSGPVMGTFTVSYQGWTSSGQSAS